MKKSSNVQKSNELKEAEMSAKENSSNAMTRKITFIGDNAISLYTNRRYLSLSLLVKLMSDYLDEDLPFEVNLTCLTLEAFAKAWKESHTQKIRKFDKIGRNDPCPCGSGKKYKNCCLSSCKFEGLKNIK